MLCRPQYAKGGKGALIKVQLHRIQQDFTSVPGQCPGCGLEFGRPFLVKGKPVSTGLTISCLCTPVPQQATPHYTPRL